MEENVSLWVGEYEGGIVVFDPSIQLKDCPHVFLWEVESQEIGKYDRSARGYFSSAKEKHRAPAIDAYRKWKDGANFSWIVEEKEYYRQRRKREQAEKVRQNFAQEKAAGIRRIVGKRGARDTYCFSCKLPISNTKQETCSECGWIKCVCGACDCSRP
ncbi:MAG: hypothetical protein R3217_01180 [Gammaproteobacteria bacterium]|nr:hypothetical protein [Gammaproteobacteria bacterium]